MKTLNLQKHTATIPLTAIASLIVIFLTWWLFDNLQSQHPSIGMIDLGILQVIALAFAAWLLLLAITLAIIGIVLSKVTTQLTDLFEPLKKLTSWQQHLLYLALFALLLLSGTGCLMAIC